MEIRIELIFWMSPYQRLAKQNIECPSSKAIECLKWGKSKTPYSRKSIFFHNSFKSFIGKISGKLYLGQPSLSQYFNYYFNYVLPT